MQAPQPLFVIHDSRQVLNLLKLSYPVKQLGPIATKLFNKLTLIQPLSLDFSWAAKWSLARVELLCMAFERSK